MLPSLSSSSWLLPPGGGLRPATFWVDDPGKKRSKVIKFDTDVLHSRGYEWWMKIAKGGKAKDAPRKLASTPPKYDTLAGVDGVWHWSKIIPVEKGIRPTKVTPKVRWVRVLVLPYWPPGVAYLDNVRLTEHPDEEKKP